MLKPIYERLKDMGVTDTDLPNNEEIVKRLLEFIDKKAIDEWARKYADWVKKKP